MASVRLFLLSLLIILSLSSIDKVQCGGSRKLLAPTFSNIPGFKFPPFPPVTEWPEYRLPPRPPIFNFPYFFSPPASTTTTTTKP
ncbi:hypothetical protein QL285_022198 [Trifolium repens]|nr:hypothetical protein QL285_022198 [Trifolium repens]